MKVAVLGAGLAGLSAAYHLNRMGIEPVLIEKEGEVGGLARTVEFDGFRLDFGPHRFHTEKGWILELAKEMLGKELEKRQRISRIMFRGKYIDYPLKPDAILSLDNRTMAKVMRDYALARVKGIMSSPREESLADWVVNRFGNELYKIYFKGYNAKIWGIDPSELSAEWASQRVDSLSMKSIIKKMMSVGRDPRTFVSEFYYPRNGIGNLSRAFESNIRGKVIKGSPVKRISRRGKFWSVEHEKGEERVDRIVSTIPVRDFIRMLDVDVPEDVRDASEGLEYRNSIFIFLLIDKDRVTDDNWIYYHPPELLISRVSQQKNFSPSCCPEGKTALTCEIFTGGEDDVWGWPDSRIVSRIKEEVVRVGLVGDKDAINGSRVYRLKKTYPLYRIGAEEKIEKVLGFLRGLGIVSTGRQGSFFHTNMDHSIEMGRKGAEEALGG